MKDPFPALRTWTALNDFLRDADERACERLLQHEQATRARPTFILRIHARLNRVRRLRERQALVK